MEKKINIIANKVIIPANCKLPFRPNISLKESSIKKCVDFANEMAYGEGFHNPSSFGNKNENRNESQIFRDALQGKIAEIAFYTYMFKAGLPPDTTPDFATWGKGAWEDMDFSLQNGKYKVSIKSTKHFGNLLCLEKNRYSLKGEFIESVDTNNMVTYDFTFLVRIKGVESGVPKDYTDYNKIECEITGFLTHKNFLQIIKDNQFIPAGTIIGIPMKVANYYICAGDLKQPALIKTYL